MSRCYSDGGRLIATSGAGRRFPKSLISQGTTINFPSSDHECRSRDWIYLSKEKNVQCNQLPTFESRYDRITRSLPCVLVTHILIKRIAFYYDSFVNAYRSRLRKNLERYARGCHNKFCLLFPSVEADAVAKQRRV